MKSRHRRRRYLFEALEERRLLASLWQNPILPLDVDDSALVNAGDALAIINRLGRVRDMVLPDVKPSGDVFCDTNGDGRATALDALLIINALHRYKDPLTFVASVATDSDPDANGVQLTDSTRMIGQTLPHLAVHIRVLGDSATPPLVSGVSDGSGNFVLEMPLSIGRNDFEVTATDPLGRKFQVIQTVQRGDAVLNWNATILNVVREWTTTSNDPYQGRIVTSQPPVVARNMAMIHTAMFDAANAISGDYEPYLPGLTSPLGASPDAALSAAAFRVASAIYSDADELAYWNAALAEALAVIPDGPAKQSGIALGNTVGDAMLLARQSDGSQATATYSTIDAPGHWDRTLPGFLPPLLPQWPNVEPFAIWSAADFRAPQPPDLSSAAYAASLDEVMRLGRVDSTERTADQTEIAVFWADGGGTATPPGHWNRIASDVLVGQGNSLVDNARTFALLNLALADAGIAAWDAKYHYDFWRPIDAIRQADLDGNGVTIADETWLPLLATPPFPTYTSGHSTFSGAADAVLTTLLGDNVSFTSQSDSHSAPGQRPIDPSLIMTRSFESFTQAADEAGVSRIYGGIHFDFDNTAGLDVGRAIGADVVRRQLQPMF
ncbi:PAP2 superfamily protein [Rubripirellula tenax]|uniref:PAP2 superfamily protein n=1 Tax=Rubripirellula tenax TaxID=2528015 RepID=A0A5C6EJQ4_9BACT|nr:dockerin type I domain-containing protein [Rubripirellula tenax]TWU48740.1 PAP2 superfamily protein [Rubripirellula tenax]